MPLKQRKLYNQNPGKIKLNDIYELAHAWYTTVQRGPEDLTVVHSHSCSCRTCRIVGKLLRAFGEEMC